LNHYFIAMCIKLCENEKWFFAPISKQRLLLALEGEILAYEVFTKNEANYIWDVEFENVNYYSGKAKIRELHSILENELPDKNISFSIFVEDYEEAIKNVQLDKIDAVSSRDRRDLVDIALKQDDCKDQEIELEVLTNALNLFQRSLYAIGSDLNYYGNNLNPKVKYVNMLVATESFKGSYGIRLKSYSINDMLDESPLQRNLEFLFALMNNNTDIESIKELIKDKNPIVLSTYYRMMKFFQNNKVTIKTTSASPKKSINTVSLMKKDIDNFILMYDTSFEPEEVIKQYTGELTAIDTVRKKFSFRVSEDISIDGKIDEGLTVNEFFLPHQAIIKLRIIINESSLKSSPTMTYLLKEITFL